jgi:hypothetical protein
MPPVRYGSIKQYSSTSLLLISLNQLSLLNSFLHSNFINFAMPDQPYASDLRKRIALRVNEFVPPRQMFTSPRPRIPPEPVRTPTPLRFPGPNPLAQEWERAQASAQGSQAFGGSPGRGSSPPRRALVIDLTMSSDEELNTIPKAPASSPVDRPKFTIISRGGTKRAAANFPELSPVRGRKAGRGTRVMSSSDDEDESPQPATRRSRKAGRGTRVVRFADDEDQRSNTPPPAPLRPSRGGGPRGLVARRASSTRGRRGRPATHSLFETPALFQSLEIRDSDEFKDSDDDSLDSYPAGKIPRLAPSVVRGSGGRRATTRGRAKTLVPTGTRGRKKKEVHELLGADNEELNDHPVLKPDTSPPATQGASEQQGSVTNPVSPPSGEGYISPIKALDTVVALARAQAHNAIDQDTYTAQQKALESLRDARERRMEEFNRLAKQQAKERLERRGNRGIDGSPAGGAEGGRPQLTWMNGRPYMR